MAKRAPTRSRPERHRARCRSAVARVAWRAAQAGVEQVAGRAGVAGPQARSASAVSRSTRSASASRPPAAATAVAGPAQVRGRLGEREPGGLRVGRRARRTPTPAPGPPPAAAAAKCRAISAADTGPPGRAGAARAVPTRRCSSSRWAAGQRGVDGLPVQVVGEPERRPGVGRDDAGRDRLVEELDHPDRVVVRRLGRARRAESWVPATAAASSIRAHGAESRARRPRITSRAAAGTPAAGPPGRREVAQLAGEERVTTAAPVDVGGPARRRVRPGDVGDQVGHLGAARPAQRHGVGHRGQTGERRVRGRGSSGR